MKKALSLALILVMVFSLTACATQEQKDSVSALSALQEDYDTLQKECDELKADNAQLEKEATEFAELKEKYSALSESEVLKQTEANNLQAEQSRQEKERLLAEEQAKKEADEAAAKAAAESEAKKGYDTGITYNQLARTPDEYKDKKVKFYGEVIQVVESTTEINLRIAVNGDYSNIIIVYYDPNIVSSRVLEDDYITVFGVSKGLYTYESTSGASITIPMIAVDKISQ